MLERDLLEGELARRDRRMAECLVPGQPAGNEWFRPVWMQVRHGHHLLQAA